MTDRKSLPEELQDRIDASAKLDKFTVAFWERRTGEFIKAYGGAMHAINLAVAEMKEACENNAMLTSGLAAANAEIGELRSRTVTLEDRIEKMSAWAAALQKQKKQSDTGN